MSQCKGIPSDCPWPNGHGGGPRGGNKETNHENSKSNDGERVAPRTRRLHQEHKGENNFNFIQINLNRARQATYDLVSYACNIKNPVIYWHKNLIQRVSVGKQTFRKTNILI